MAGIITRLSRLEAKQPRKQRRRELPQVEFTMTTEEYAVMLETLFEVLGADGLRALLLDRGLTEQETAAIIHELGVIENGQDTVSL